MHAYNEQFKQFIVDNPQSLPCFHALVQRLDDVDWYPKYGCCVVFDSEDPFEFRVRVLGLDGWRLQSDNALQPKSKPSLDPTSLCVGSVLRSKREEYRACFVSLLNKAKQRSKDNKQRSAVQHEQGHQKTPTFIEAVAKDALGLETETAHNTPPRGEMTDVGMHTGGTARCTSWPLFQYAVVDQVRDLELDVDSWFLLARFQLWMAERSQNPMELRRAYSAYSQFLTEDTEHECLFRRIQAAWGRRCASMRPEQSVCERLCDHELEQIAVSPAQPMDFDTRRANAHKALKRSSGGTMDRWERESSVFDCWLADETVDCEERFSKALPKDGIELVVARSRQVLVQWILYLQCFDRCVQRIPMVGQYSPPLNPDDLRRLTFRAPNACKSVSKVRNWWRGRTVRKRPIFSYLHNDATMDFARRYAREHLFDGFEEQEKDVRKQKSDKYEDVRKGKAEWQENRNSRDRKHPSYYRTMRMELPNNVDRRLEKHFFDMLRGTLLYTLFKLSFKAQASSHASTRGRKPAPDFSTRFASPPDCVTKRQRGVERSTLLRCEAHAQIETKPYDRLRGAEDCVSYPTEDHWLYVAESDDNVFCDCRACLDARTLRFTATLPDKSIQWCMPQYDDEDWTRGNWAEAGEHTKPEWLTRHGFRAFASVRPVPTLQVSKLCKAVRQEELPLERPAVLCLFQQVFFQRSVSLSKDDLTQWTTVVNERIDVLRSKPRAAASLLLFGTVSSFASQFHDELISTANELADVAEGWVDKVEAGDSRCSFFWRLACLCQTTDTPERRRKFVQRLVMADHTRAMSSSDQMWAEVERVAYDVAIQLRADEENWTWMTTHVATKLLPSVTIGALEWAMVEGTLGVEAVDDDAVYTVNLRTGEFRYNGEPLAHLPRAVRDDPLYQSYFGARDFRVTHAADGWLAAIDDPPYSFRAQSVREQTVDGGVMFLCDARTQPHVSRLLCAQHSMWWKPATKELVLRRPTYEDDRSPCYVIDADGVCTRTVDGAILKARNTIDARSALLRAFEQHPDGVQVLMLGTDRWYALPRYDLTFKGAVWNEDDGWCLSVPTVSPFPPTFRRWFALRNTDQWRFGVPIPKHVAKGTFATDDDSTSGQTMMWYDLHPRFRRLRASGLCERLWLAAIYVAFDDHDGRWTDEAVECVGGCYANRLHADARKACRSLVQVAQDAAAVTVLLACQELADNVRRSAGMWPDAISDAFGHVFADARTEYELRWKAGLLNPRRRFDRATRQRLGLLKRADAQPSASTLLELAGFEVAPPPWQSLGGFARRAPVSAPKDVMMVSDTEIGRRSIDELNRSIGLCTETWGGGEAAALPLHETTNRRTTLETSLLEAVNESIPRNAEGWRFRTERVVGFQTSLTAVDLLRIAAQPSFVSECNPFLDQTQVATVRRGIELWMEWCVFEDKLSRMQRSNEARSEEARHTHRHRCNEWLIFEVEQQLQIRTNQLAVAEWLLSRPADVHPMIQMNMGEGKTRVVLPLLVLASSRSTSTIPRLLLLRSLINEAVTYLRRVLTDSALRVRIDTLHYERSVVMDGGLWEALHKPHANVRRCVCVDPQSVLSHRLQSIETETRLAVPPTFDVFDECDEIFDPRHELNYAVGSAIALPDGPAHWQTVQRLLACGVTGSEELFRLYAERYDASLVAYESYVCDAAVEANPQTVVPAVAHVLRGMLAHGLLAHGLSLRNRVDYGIARGRRPVRAAVPFRASEVPSDKAEYVHPGELILLTLLAYHDDGLQDSEVAEAVRCLLALDIHAQNCEYQRWCAPHPPPPSFDTVQKLDLDNAEQRRLLTRFFAKTRPTIDFWLDQCVFPLETQQYTRRFRTSPWFLSERPSVGFSGTRDTALLWPERYTLEWPIDDLRGTDGHMVRLLRSQTLKIVHEGTSGSVIEAALTHQVNAVLDVGALLTGQALEAVADQLRSLGRCVAFFDTDDAAWAYLDGTTGRRRPTVPQRTCTVLFDEYRCRGVDVKLDDDAVALLTLCPSLTKDKLMQAAGRLRRLHRGQKLILFVPSSIQGIADVDDVIRHVLTNDARYVAAKFPTWIQHREHRLQGDARVVSEHFEVQTLYGAASTPAFVTDYAASFGRPPPERIRKYGADIRFAASLGHEVEREREVLAERERECETEYCRRTPNAESNSCVVDCRFAKVAYMYNLGELDWPAELWISVNFGSTTQGTDPPLRVPHFFDRKTEGVCLVTDREAGRSPQSCLPSIFDHSTDEAAIAAAQFLAGNTMVQNMERFVHTRAAARQARQHIAGLGLTTRLRDSELWRVIALLDY